MSGNSIGLLFRLTSFGESHGEAVGGVIDGCPAGFAPDMDFIQAELLRRRPGMSSLSSIRKEKDEVVFISGLFEGKTTGAPLAFLIPSVDPRPADYDSIRDIFRPSHADYSWEARFGMRDHRGGGRSSGRETAVRVVAGTVAKQLLAMEGMEIVAYTAGIGKIQLHQYYTEITKEERDLGTLCCPEADAAELMKKEIESAVSCQDSIGSLIHCVVRGLPAGIGNPVFDRLDAELAKAIMSIPAVKAFESGSGTKAAMLKGSEHNDPFFVSDGKVQTISNHSGGIQGGISNGMPLLMKVSMKPPSSIGQKQKTINRDGLSAELEIKGRHDPCLVPRALVVVEAMTAITLFDMILRTKTTSPFI